MKTPLPVKPIRALLYACLSIAIVFISKPIVKQVMPALALVLGYVAGGAA